MTDDELRKAARKGRLYRNSRNNKIYMCMGFFPNIADSKDYSKGVVILTDVWGELDKQPAVSIPLKEFKLKVSVKGISMDRFILLEPPKEPVEIPETMRRLHEYEERDRKQKVKFNLL